MEKIVSLCKRRGFIYPSSDIYGGLNSCYDYGPLGIELKKRVKDLWWKSMVYNHDNIEGLDSSILMHPDIWKASGHIDNFSDPMVDCKECKSRFREDKLPQGIKSCPNCKSNNSLTEARQFNLMFKTFMGPLEDAANTVFLRPETAQGIYVNYQNVMTTSRQKLPFGIAQIGKAFRNEITPGNFTFRTREFEQMEMQFFIHADQDDHYMQEWKEKRWQWYLDLGIAADKIRFHEHTGNELAHYAKAAYDIEFEFPFGWNELEGIHNRTNFDLKQHQTFSKKNLTYYDEASKEKFLPYIIETSAGCDRSILAFICNAYVEDGERTVLKFSHKLAPIQLALLPLQKKNGMPELAKSIQKNLPEHVRCFYDAAGSIGKRYRRQDEIGTPLCLTIDHDTLEKQTVTIRHRDSMEQETIGIDAINQYLLQYMS